MKALKTKLLAVVLSVCGLCFGAGMTASAYTIDEVMAKAREIGMPEEEIMSGYNMWAAGMYTQEQLDNAYEYLCDLGYMTDEMIEEMFGKKETTPSVTEPGDSGTTETVPDAPAATEPDAEVSPEDFINMTLDEKKAYVNAMSPEEREAFLNNLTPEQRKSIIKQMSLEDQATILQGYIDAAGKLDMSVTVDSISEEGIALTVRDNAGVIVNKAEAGLSIDATGIAYDGLLAVSAAAMLLAALGFTGVNYYLCRTDKKE